MPARGVAGPIVALTGTPGTGKSTVAAALRAAGHAVLDLARYVGDARFDEGADADHHDAVTLDEEALSRFLADHLVDELAGGADGAVFIDSHFAHELDVVDRAIVLRCRPAVLRERLAVRDWPATKVQANLEAEALDLIVQDCVEIGVPAGEVDTTDAAVPDVVAAVLRLATAAPESLEIGTVDWSDEVLGWY